MMEAPVNTNISAWPVRYNNGFKIYGPPPEYQQVAPEKDFEIIIRNLRMDNFETVIIPLILEHSHVYQIKVKEKPADESYCFVSFLTYEAKESAYYALRHREIIPGNQNQGPHILQVYRAIQDRCLYIAKIPTTKKVMEIKSEIIKLLSNVEKINVPTGKEAKGDNDHLGFAFIYFESFRHANEHYKKIVRKDIVLFDGEPQTFVYWAARIYKETPSVVLYNIPEESMMERLETIIKDVSGNNFLSCEKLKDKGQLIVEVPNHMIAEIIRWQFGTYAVDGVKIKVDLVPKTPRMKEILYHECTNPLGHDQSVAHSSGHVWKPDNNALSCNKSSPEESRTNVSLAKAKPLLPSSHVPITSSTHPPQSLPFKSTTSLSYQSYERAPVIQNPVPCIPQFQTLTLPSNDPQFFNPLNPQIATNLSSSYGLSAPLVVPYHQQPGSIPSPSYMPLQGLIQPVPYQAISIPVVEGVTTDKTKQPPTSGFNRNVIYNNMSAASHSTLKNLLQGFEDFPIPILFGAIPSTVVYAIDASFGEPPDVILVPFVKAEVEFR